MDKEQLQEELDEVVKMCKDKGLDQMDAFRVALFYSMKRYDMNEFDDVEPLWEQTSEMASKIGFESKFGEICLN
jgi:MoaA/NifB/PqqE/SkfB family radical SAM enzyme